MVEERGYERRVGPGGPAPLVLRSAESFGAGVGRAIEEVGDTAHQLQLRSYRLDRQENADSEAADFARRSAEERLAIDEEIRQSRNRPEAGAAGHADAVEKALAARKTKLLDGITEDSVRRNAEAQWTDYSVRIVSGERAYEAGKTVERLIDNNEKSVMATENLIARGTGDEETYREEMALQFAGVDAMENVAGDIKEKRKDEIAQRLSLAHLEAKAVNDPIGLQAEIAAGRWDNVLDKKQIDYVERAAATEIKAQAVEIAQAASEARTAWKNERELVEARIERGEAISPKELQQLQVTGRTIGIPEADLVRLGTEVEDNAVLRAFNAANDPDGQRSAATVAGIDDRIRSGTAKPEDYRLRDKLAGFADARATDIGKQLKEMAGQGVPGQIAALDAVDKLPPQSRFRAAGELGDNLGYVALIKPHVRKAALSGMADISANKDLVDAEAFKARYRAATKSVGLGTSEAALEGRMQVAIGYYAHYAKAKGLKPETVDPDIFDAALRVAFGGERRNDQWQGGVGRVRGRTIVLPDGHTAQRFDQRMSRLTFADAVYRDGRPVRKADILNNYTPVIAGNTAEGHARYHFVDENGDVLKMKDGRPFPMVMD
jgi:hypothetical protein